MHFVISYQYMIDCLDNARAYWDGDTSWGPIDHLIFDTMPDRLDNLKEELDPYLDKMRKDKLKVQSFRILDIAAGAQEVYFPNDLIPNITPTDISIVKLRTQNVPGKSVLADNRTRLPFANDKFSWATTFFSMRYLTLEQQVKLVKEMLAVSGGKILIFDHEEPTHHSQEVGPFFHNDIAKLIENITFAKPIHKKIWQGAGPNTPAPLWMIGTKL